MLVGRRYRLKLDARQGAYAQRVAGACRALWNAALEQRRTAAELNRHRTPERQHWPSLASQSRELTEAKHTETWLAEAPANCLQQTLRDLDRTCLLHTIWGDHFRSKRRSPALFRFVELGENELRQSGRVT
jgi:hypothetical protein